MATNSVGGNWIKREDDFLKSIEPGLNVNLNGGMSSEPVKNTNRSRKTTPFLHPFCISDGELSTSRDQSHKKATKSEYSMALSRASLRKKQTLRN